MVVVGIGNTACDVAGDLCGSAKQVYLSHRSGGRVVSSGIAGDLTLELMLCIVLDASI